MERIIDSQLWKVIQEIDTDDNRPQGANQCPPLGGKMCL